MRVREKEKLDISQQVKFKRVSSRILFHMPSVFFKPLGLDLKPYAVSHVGSLP